MPAWHQLQHQLHQHLPTLSASAHHGPTAALLLLFRRAAFVFPTNHCLNSRFGFFTVKLRSHRADVTHDRPASTATARAGRN